MSDKASAPGTGNGDSSPGHEPDVKSQEGDQTSSSSGDVAVKAEGRAGIPQAVFVEDVDAFMQQAGNTSAEVVIKRFDEQHSKYKFMELNLSQKKKRLRGQIPDIQKSLDMVNFLKSKQGSAEATPTHFLLSDAVYGTAEANVMLEYPIAEAEQLLKKNLDAAMTSLKQVEEDLDFVKDQCTTVEVDMARIYNWDVKERRKKK